jgi:hypothetical protein
MYPVFTQTEFQQTQEARPLDKRQTPPGHFFFKQGLDWFSQGPFHFTKTSLCRLQANALM